MTETIDLPPDLHHGYPSAPSGHLVNWLGGKAASVKWLISLMPPHRAWLDLFGGGGIVTAMKPPAAVETYNDLHNGLYALFRCVCEPHLYEDFVRRVALAPVSREYHEHAWFGWREAEDLVERAALFWVAQRQNFGGNTTQRAWGFAKGASSRGMAMTTSRWLSAVEGLPEWHARFQRVQIESRPWEKALKLHDHKDCLIYADPPYMVPTRRWKAKNYEHEFTVRDHVQLLRALAGAKGMVMLSGYDHRLYRVLERHGWVKRTRDTVANSVPKTDASGRRGAGGLSDQTRTECVWLSPRAQAQSAQLSLLLEG